MDKVSFKSYINVGAIVFKDTSTNRPCARVVAEVTDQGRKDLSDWEPALKRFPSLATGNKKYIIIDRLSDPKNPLKIPPFFRLNERIIDIEMQEIPVLGQISKFFHNIAMQSEICEMIGWKHSPYQWDTIGYPKSKIYLENYGLPEYDIATFTNIHNFENVKSIASNIDDDLQKALNTLILNA